MARGQRRAKLCPKSEASTSGSEDMTIVEDDNLASSAHQHQLMRELPVMSETRPPGAVNLDVDKIKTPKPKRRRTSRKKCKFTKRKRINSLCLLTKNFVGLLNNSTDGVIDLNVASVKLGVPKRRLYDVTNVLQGIGMVEKKSKSNIEWTYEHLMNFEKYKNLKQDMQHLEAKENMVDSLLHTAERSFRKICEEKALAYVMCEDLSEYKTKAVITIQAPPESKLEIPDDSYKIFMKSANDKIKVNLPPSATISKSKQSTPIIPSEDVLETCNTMDTNIKIEVVDCSQVDPDCKDSKDSFDCTDEINSVVSNDASFESFSSANSKANQFQNRLISESDDFGSEGQLIIDEDNKCTNPFPLLSDDDYSFCLDNKEGLTELFDLNL